MSEDIIYSPQLLKHLRKSLGMTQEAMAKKLGVSFTSVNRWEKGRTKPIKLAELQIMLLAKECDTELLLNSNEGGKAND